jgi:2-iminoacetate synthase ThiH
VAIEIGSVQEVIEPPAGKDIDARTVEELRRMLRLAGYSPS